MKKLYFLTYIMFICISMRVVACDLLVNNYLPAEYCRIVYGAISHASSQRQADAVYRLVLSYDQENGAPIQHFDKLEEVYLKRCHELSSEN